MSVKTTIKRKLPSLNKSKATSDSDLEYFREIILAQLAEALQEIERLRGNLLKENFEKDDHAPLYSWHMADVGSDVMHQEFIYYMIDRQNRLIKMLNSALERILDKTYGLCIVTGKPISRERLEAIPYTQFSLEALSAGSRDI